MRIGDAERDAAAADLGEHFTAGRLTLEELHERLEAVFAAKTFGQLARIMSDLPGPGRLPGLARLSRHPATPGMPGRPWMPASGARLQLGRRVERRDARLGHGLGQGRIPAGLEVQGPAGREIPRPAMCSTGRRRPTGRASSPPCRC